LGIVVHGAKLAGKSSFITQLLWNEFNGEALRNSCMFDTTPAVNSHTVYIQEHYITLEVTDAAVPDEYDALREKLVRLSHRECLFVGVVLQLSCFFVAYTSMRHVPCVIVGNKLDLILNDAAKASRQVAYDRVRKVALNYGVKFIEAIAKDNINVYKVFEELAIMILQNRVYKDDQSKKKKQEQAQKQQQKQTGTYSDEQDTGDFALGKLPKQMVKNTGNCTVM